MRSSFIFDEIFSIDNTKLVNNSVKNLILEKIIKKYNAKFKLKKNENVAMSKKMQTPAVWERFINKTYFDEKL